MSAIKASDFKVGGGALCIKETTGFTKGQWYFVSKVNIDSVTLIDDEDDSSRIHRSLNNFVPFPNEPLVHSRERIAYAMGADIECRHEYEHDECDWVEVGTPKWFINVQYRVKTPETETPNQKSIRILETKIKEMSIELNKLKEQS
jgi:hypothetical protein